MIPIRQNERTYTILARDHHATPCANMDGPIRTSLPPCHPICQNGLTYNMLARDRHASHTPKWTDQSEHHKIHATHTLKRMVLRQLARDRHATHTQTGWTYTILARDYISQIRQNGRTDQNITTSMSPIRQNGWTYAILARDRHATPYAKMDGAIRSSLPPCHQYTKMGGVISFLHANTIPPIHQHGRTNKSITNSMPPHTPKWTDF
jgi:hypothetical protein